MNREIKRRMKRDQKAAEKSIRARPQMPPTQQKREKVKMRQYLREIRLELKRVIWPTRQAVITYSFVVIVVVSALTGLVFLLDLGFSKALLELFRTNR